MTMLEKIARAMCEARSPVTGWPMLGDDPDFSDRPNTEAGRDGEELLECEVIELARAALLAMREPDDAMIDAAINREEDIVGTYGCADPTGEFTPDGPSICFTAMIDAILGPQND